METPPAAPRKDRKNDKRYQERKKIRLNRMFNDADVGTGKVWMVREVSAFQEIVRICSTYEIAKMFQMSNPGSSVTSHEFYDVAWVNRHMDEGLGDIDLANMRYKNLE